jgi:hypothetical protein
VRVIRQCTINHHHMIAMLRGLQALDEDAYNEVPDIFKRGLASQQHQHRVLAYHTADKIAARAATIASKGWLLEPYNQERFEELFEELTPKMESNMRESVVTLALCIHYFLSSKLTPRRDTLGLLGEAVPVSGRRSRAGRIKTAPQQSSAGTASKFAVGKTWRMRDSRCARVCLCVLNLTQKVSQVEVLHTCSFAFNCRVLETGLHRRFKDNHNRLWQKTGAGSYRLKDADIEYQQENALISTLFLVYAPLTGGEGDGDGWG